MPSSCKGKNMYDFKTEDAVRFASFIGISTIQSGTELRFKKCPYCKSSKDMNTFAINLTNGAFNCKRASCGAKGNMITLARDFNFSLGSNNDEFVNPKKKFRDLNTPKDPIKPKKEAIEYLESRCISEKTSKVYEITVQNRDSGVLVFPFYDEKGILRFVKYRNTKFVKGTTDGAKEWCEKNCKPILFGMKQIGKPDKSKRVVITEGQMDTLAVYEAGYHDVVSVPTGAKGFTWIPYCWEWLNGFGEIIVFGDYENGKISLLDDISKRFSKVTVKHVREEDYIDCKDANEILIKYGSDQVLKCIENAVCIPVERVVQLSDVKAKNIYELEKVKTGITELDKLLYGGLPFGTVTILSGKRGEGKSTFGNQILINAIEAGYPCFAYSGELPNYLFKSWIDFQIAGKNHIIENTSSWGYVNRYINDANQNLINSWYQNMMYIYDSENIDGDEKDCLLETIRETILRYGVRVVLLDNLMTAMYMDESDSRDKDKFDRQGSFVRKLTQIAVRYNVQIILVAHKRKNNFTEDANDEVSGSADITNLAGITLSYGRDKDIDPNQRKLLVPKNRIFGKTNFEGYVLDYDERSKRIYGYKDDPNREFSWLPESDGFVSADDEELIFD